MQVAFKGGTALSKCWSAIDRFSEDIDLSLHWADLAGLTEDEYNTAWQETTSSRTQNDKFRKEQQYRLTTWATNFEQKLNAVLAQYGIPELTAKLDANSKGEKIEIQYPHVVNSGSGYQLDHILLEFGGRNRGCPTQQIAVQSYLASVPLSGIELPTANPHAYHLGYIAWEKLTALHQFCTQQKQADPTRLARHWYDVYCLLERQIVNPLSNITAMNAVIEMKSARWAVPGVNYKDILEGNIKLIPSDRLYTLIRADHERGIAGGLFFGIPPSFDEIIDKLEQLQQQINMANSK